MWGPLGHVTMGAWHVGGTSRSCGNVGVVHEKEIRMDWYSSTWHCLRWSGGCNVWVWHVPISHAKKVGSY